jgi:hypothetical protein
MRLGFAGVQRRFPSSSTKAPPRTLGWSIPCRRRGSRQMLVATVVVSSRDHTDFASGRRGSAPRGFVEGVAACRLRDPITKDGTRSGDSLQAVGLRTDSFFEFQKTGGPGDCRAVPRLACLPRSGASMAHHAIRPARCVRVNKAKAPLIARTRFTSRGRGAMIKKIPGAGMAATGYSRRFPSAHLAT